MIRRSDGEGSQMNFNSQRKGNGVTNQRLLVAQINGFLSLIAYLSTCSVTHGQSALPVEWPRVIFRDGVTNTIYQPQLESWDYFTLKASSAVAVQPNGVSQPTFGTIGFVAKKIGRASC